MSCWLNGVSRVALVACVGALALPLPSLAASFTVSSGTTDTTAKTVTGTDTGTVQNGGTLATGGNAITWTGAGSSVTIINFGSITSSTARGFDTSSSVSNGSLFFTNSAGATITSSNDALRINGSIGNGTVVINNYGTMTSTTNGRAIQLDANSSTTGSVTINNFTGGLLQSLGDADALRPGMNGVVNNWGTINAAAGSGDGVDFQDRTATVNNKSGGLITAAKHGINAGNGFINVNNDAGGTIIGRNGSGVGSDNTNATNAATVVNSGRITGAYNGSGTGDGDGVDIDGAATITNYASGIIEGTGAAGFDSGNRANNSEGISIGGGTILNYGTISGASYGIVVNNDSNVDNSRSGVAATTLTNYGSIAGANGFAIRFENKWGDSRDNDTIVNYGTITGTGAIPTGTVLRGDGTPDPGTQGTVEGVNYTSVANAGSARFIRGDGSAIQMGQGADQLTNYGTIIGNNGRAINMEGGNDTVRIMPGSKIVGLVNGGTSNPNGLDTDTDTLVYAKVGLTAAKMAALQAGQTVNIGGTLYTGFENFTGSTVRSFSSYATSGATQGIASAFDNMTGAANINTQTLIDQVASSSDVTAALAQLTPTAFQAFTTAGFNNAFQTTTLAGNRLSNVRDGILAFDASNVDSVAALVNGETPRTVGEAVANAYAANASMAQNPAFAAMAKAGGGVTKAPRMIEGDTPWGMFLYGNALFARQNATSNGPQTKFNAAGFTAGVDYRVTPDLVVGVLGGYTRTNADLDTLGSTSKINTWLLGAYGTYYRQNWFVNGAFVYGRNSYDNNRIALGTSNTSSPKGDQYAVQGTVGVDLRYGGWIVTPELGGQYTMVRIDAFTETGSAALAVDSDKADSFRSSLGARFRYDWQTDFGIVTPELRASWQHEFLDKERDIRASFVDQSLPGTFATTAAGSGTDFGIVGAGLTANIATRMQMMLGYDFKFGGHDFQAHQLSGRLRYVF